jgi:hypothetical protein
MKLLRQNSALAWVLLAIGLGILSQRLGAQVLVGPVLNPANGHNYYLLETNYPIVAEAQAVELGGHLVTINDAAENAWVLTTFGNYGGVPRELQIGLTDEGHEGQWVWMSGEPVTYLNWSPVEPNNGAGFYPHENYALMYPTGDPWPLGSWNDIEGSLPQPAFWSVVEVPAGLSIRVSQVELCWPTVTNLVYQLQYTTNVTSNVWTPLGGQINGTGARFCTTDVVAEGQPGRFYRIVTVQ